jgi:hypothetical protein
MLHVGLSPILLMEVVDSLAAELHSEEVSDISVPMSNVVSRSCYRTAAMSPHYDCRCHRHPPTVSGPRCTPEMH